VAYFIVVEPSGHYKNFFLDPSEEVLMTFIFVKAIYNYVIMDYDYLTRFNEHDYLVINVNLIEYYD